MKASKFTDAQKAFILKQGADGHPVAELCRKAGISGSLQILSHIFSSDGGFGWVFLGLKQWPHVHVPFR